VHSIQAALLGRTKQAYEFYLRTSRLDLDDYNKEVEQGCHITSMAGTWMSIVEAFGGMRVKEDQLSFNPTIPEDWKTYSFKVNFRDQILKVKVSADKMVFFLEGDNAIEINVNGKTVEVQPNQELAV